MSSNNWCQRWRERRHGWRHRSESGVDPRRYDVDLLDEAAARAFVVRHHYARAYVAARLRFGLYEGPELVGAAVLGVPVRAAVLTGVFPHLVPYGIMRLLSLT